MAHCAFLFSKMDRTSREWHQPPLRKCLKNQVVVQRRKQGRNEATTFLMVDAQSVQNTDTVMEKGYDAGKKVSGIANCFIFSYGI